MIAARTLCLLLLALLTQQAQAQDRPKPGDFAWRAQIGLPVGALAAQILLPAEAMAQFRSPARQDLRVFNADGEAVTLVLLSQSTGSAAAPRLQTASFDALPLMESAGGQAPDKGTVKVQMDENGKTAIWVTPGTTAASTDKASPALRRLPAVLLDTRKANQTISSLMLEADLPANMLVHFNLASSTDLVRWTPIALSGPLFRFDGAGAPTTQTLGLRQPLALQDRYLRLSWEAAGVQVKAARGDLTPAELPAPRLRLPLAAGQSQGENILSWPTGSVAPLAGLQLASSRANTLVPVRVLGRNDSAQPWRQLAQGLVYRVGEPGQESVNPTIDLNGVSVRWLQVEATHGMSLAGVTLQASVEFTPMPLVFLASGKPPFEVAVGRERTAPGAVDPALLRGVLKGRLEDLPIAQLEPARTQDLSAWNTPLLRLLPGSGEQRKLLLWLVLVGGVLILGLAAYGLFKQLSVSAAEAGGKR